MSVGSVQPSTRGEVGSGSINFVPWSNTTRGWQIRGVGGLGNHSGIGEDKDLELTQRPNLAPAFTNNKAEAWCRLLPTRKFKLVTVGFYIEEQPYLFLM